MIFTQEAFSFGGINKSCPCINTCWMYRDATYMIHPKIHGITNFRTFYQSETLSFNIRGARWMYFVCITVYFGDIRLSGGHLAVDNRFIVEYIKIHPSTSQYIGPVKLADYQHVLASSACIEVVLRMYQLYQIFLNGIWLVFCKYSSCIVSLWITLTRVHFQPQSGSLSSHLPH